MGSFFPTTPTISFNIPYDIFFIIKNGFFLYKAQLKKKEKRKKRQNIKKYGYWTGIQDILFQHH